MVSGTLALCRYSVIYMNMMQGSSPGMGRSPVEWGKILSVHLSICPPPRGLSQAQGGPNQAQGGPSQALGGQIQALEHTSQALGDQSQALESLSQAQGVLSQA